VDAFIYSPLFEGWQQGKNFTGMMHVSDWFPTILELAGVEYTPEPGYDLDGVSQVEGFYGNGGQRDFMLYNAYIHINSKDFSVYNGGALAVRNNKYKLVHAYVDNAYSDWYQFYDENEDDDSFALGECDQFGAIDSGTYSYFLFDLFADPYETTNLYYDEKYNGIKV
jgi:arylsulfatase A-like enzyme